ncbi:MAG: hypothetical protein FWB88_07570 [Defluviitaleaceae bacterium]|nr:hypothetical protein [Defluviitaleaceae bacterium]MCL2203782.1 hypothetical protein [Defluviitaleaceae bacterium]MCL2239251.1 hypothetical protein [Defluviitaleaceae bacterium]
MAGKYILGVDGGNSKTDYLLCRADGAFVDIMRASNCSHENHERGFDWMEETMEGHVRELCKRNNISVGDIAAASFGLAGADEPEQIAELKRRVTNMGFGNIAVANDGILGVKAVASAGVCAINGSGVVVVGIDDGGNFLQVGGVGELSGDAGGGGYIARQAVLAAYKEIYRAGEKSAITPGILEILNVAAPFDLHTAVNRLGYSLDRTRDIIRLADDAAQKGDAVAARIFDGVGISCGQGVVGCVRNLSFAGEVVVVKAGSIWNVIGYPGMVAHFARTIREGLDAPTRFELLESTPALGALFWAKELLDGKIDPGYREEMRRFLTPEKYNALA